MVLAATHTSRSSIDRDLLGRDQTGHELARRRPAPLSPLVVITARAFDHEHVTRSLAWPNQLAARSASAWAVMLSITSVSSSAARAASFICSVTRTAAAASATSVRQLDARGDEDPTRAHVPRQVPQHVRGPLQIEVMHVAEQRRQPRLGAEAISARSSSIILWTSSRLPAPPTLQPGAASPAASPDEQARRRASTRTRDRRWFARCAETIAAGRAGACNEDAMARNYRRPTAVESRVTAPPTRSRRRGRRADRDTRPQPRPRARAARACPRAATGCAWSRGWSWCAGRP